ncbi:hypothetical protein [Staphylococcus equorum]|nr:hypothetical protein [Staphylococcus equorum]
MSSIKVSERWLAFLVATKEMLASGNITLKVLNNNRKTKNPE